MLALTSVCLFSSITSAKMVKIAWERELWSLMTVAAVARFRIPAFRGGEQPGVTVSLANSRGLWVRSSPQTRQS